jgi:hypothetical protein
MSARRGGRWEVADVFRRHGDAYRRDHRLSLSQHKAIRGIERCRTAELGGHLEKCNRCGHERPCYNSCRNRHCPKCQCLTKARWLDARKAEVLPVRYFHVVFTLPHELNPLALFNKKQVYALLFQSVSRTLLAFGKKTFGGTIGATMILHTWDQRLNDHLHVHCAIPSGALSETGWIPARENFLFPVKAMAVMFRGKFLSGLKNLATREEINTPPDFQARVRSLYEKDWVVYAKPAFRGPQSVLDYIGRYTHRVAISNERILNVENDQITLSYRDRQDSNKKKALTLSAEEFIRRFLIHVLPSSFMKIRHIGFLANKSKKKSLARCRAALGTIEIKPEKKNTRELFKELTGRDLDQCPHCRQGTMVVVGEIPKPLFDSS